MDQIVIFVLMIAIMTVGMDVITKPVPVVNQAYRWMLRTFVKRPVKALWRRLEKSTRRKRRDFWNWLWALPWRGLCAIWRGIKFIWVRAFP